MKKTSMLLILGTLISSSCFAGDLFWSVNFTDLKASTGNRLTQNTFFLDVGAINSQEGIACGIFNTRTKNLIYSMKISPMLPGGKYIARLSSLVRNKEQSIAGVSNKVEDLVLNFVTEDLFNDVGVATKSVEITLASASMTNELLTIAPYEIDFSKSVKLSVGKRSKTALNLGGGKVKEIIVGCDVFDSTH